MAEAVATETSVFEKSAETEVKYLKDGNTLAENVPYTAKQAANLEGAMELADAAVAKIGDKEDDTVVTAENRQDLMVNWILAKFNAVMEANARQNARNAFLTTVAGPDKAIAAMAKKLASLKKITEAEAEKQIRAQFGF